MGTTLKVIRKLKEARSGESTLVFGTFTHKMTRGNQRDLARAKNAKKQAELKKSQGAGGDVVKRKERDADVMREKQRLAEAKKAEQAAKK